jgi:polar amino acid transport system permease protein
MEDFLHYLTLPYLWQGAVIAVELLVGALTGGLIIGFFVALACMARYPWIRLPARAYVYTLRGTPVLLQLILLYNVLPQFGLRLSPFMSAMLALMINETAFCSEIIRGGITAVDRHQRVAAQAFGFSKTTEMLHVVLPQALRAILPTLGNEAVGLLKSTSLASVVGVNELTMRGQTIVSQNFLFIPVLVASGAIYVLMSSAIAGMQWWLETRFGLDHRARRARRRRQRTGVPLGDLPTIAPVPMPARDATRNILEIHSLHVRYGPRDVLQNLDISVRRGEVVALLGRSGSGKSTLLKSILALTPVTGGKILVAGRPVGVAANGKRLSEARLRRSRAEAQTGIVFQHFALFDHLTALENVMTIPTLVQGLSRSVARAKASRALAAVGLSEFAASLPHELSGGQQQRVAIARALAGEPQLLLFDEPTSSLDPELVLEVNQTIRALAHTGITMVLSTHDIAFAATVADRIVFLENGRLVEDGPPEILQLPRTVAFSAFLKREQQANRQHDPVAAHADRQAVVQ